MLLSWTWIRFRPPQTGVWYHAAPLLSKKIDGAKKQLIARFIPAKYTKLLLNHLSPASPNSRSFSQTN